jgi:hypothetical protein
MRNKLVKSLLIRFGQDLSSERAKVLKKLHPGAKSRVNFEQNVGLIPVLLLLALSRALERGE